MIIGGVVLGILFESIFNMFEQSVSDHKDCTASTFMKKFDSSSMNQHDDYTTTTSPSPSPKERFEDDPEAAVFGGESNKGPSAENMLVNFVLAAAIVAPALFIGHFEGWTVGESIYFSIVTATTGEPLSCSRTARTTGTRTPTAFLYSYSLQYKP